ncbi:MAG: SMP-30/gluconolactonase/LRE family protein [Angustibacter sp.]
MRRLLTTVVVTAVLAPFALLAPSSAGAAPRSVPHPQHLRPSVVTSFADLRSYPFAESMAPYPGGRFVVSVTTCNASCTHDYGRLWLASRDGNRRPFGPRFDIPTGILTGVAVDAQGRVFVGYVTGAARPRPGVMRVSPDGTVTRVMTLPVGSFPNGVTLAGGRLLVSDSANGAIWAASAGHASAPARPWFRSHLLRPGSDPSMAIGANGIAVRHGSVYVASWARGLLLRIRMTSRGAAGAASVLARGPRLVEADGIAFDRAGRLWVTVNTGALLVISPTGRVTRVPLPEGTLDYPTQAVVRGASVFVLNGSFFNSTPNLVRLTS